MWYENPLLRTALQSAFKRSNARIVNLAKKYGTSSPVYKSELDKFSKPNYKQFMDISKSGRSFYKYVDGQKVLKNVTTGGYEKFNVKKINQYILSGNADRSVVNQLLSEAIGYRINEKGDLEKLRHGGGISTVSDIRKTASQAAKRMGINPHEMNNAELDKFANAIMDFRSNFQTSYDEFMAASYGGPKVGSKDAVISQMYDRKKALTYDQMIEINQRFNDYKNGLRFGVEADETELGKDL